MQKSKGRTQKSTSKRPQRLPAACMALVWLTSCGCLLPSAFGVAASPPPSDIRGIVPPQPFYIQSGGFWLAIGAGVVVLVAAALWFFRRQPGKVAPPTFTPREIAARRLEELAARIDSLDARAFGAAVADVLREYIGAQYALHPERQTSEEFLSSITGSRTFSVVEHALLREFLETCDLLKFARLDATLEGKRRLLVQAREFLEGSAPVPPPLPAAVAAVA